MERATAREAELGGPLPHLTELGVDEADLRAYGAGNDARTTNTVLQAARSHRTSTAQVAMLREQLELSACAQDAALGGPTPAPGGAGVLVAVRAGGQVRDVGLVRAQGRLR